MAGRVTYTNGRLRAYTASLPARADRLAGALAHAIEAGAKQRAPVDTGALRNSIQTARESAGRWRVNVGVEYAIYVEFGTYRRAAQPYLVPAVQDTAKRLVPLAKIELAP